MKWEGRKRSGSCLAGRCIIILAFLAAGLAGGCGREEETGREQAEKEKIVLWSYYETDAQIHALDELIRDFNLSQNEYEASRQYVPMTEFTRKLSMAYTEQALPDLAVIDNPDMPACIRMGMFEDITDFAQSLDGFAYYYPSLMETVGSEGRIYGLPFNCNNTALIYNKEMLQEKGLEPPDNWEELEAAAALLTTEECSGFLMSAVEGEQGAFQILPWILATGERKEDIGGEGTAQAFAFIQDLAGKGYLSSNCINLSQTDVARVFANGEAAMMENGPWVIPLLESTGVPYGVSRLPGNVNRSVIAGGENLGVLKGKNTEGAKAFIAYYNQDRVMSEFCVEACALPVKSNVTLPDTAQTGQLDIFKEQMEDAVVRTSIPGWNSLSGRLSDAFYQLIAGEITPRQAADLVKNNPPTLNN